MKLCLLLWNNTGNECKIPKQTNKKTDILKDVKANI